MARETHKSYCRFCHNYCALEVDVEDRRPIAVRGDASDPVYGGYTCIKGRQLPEQWAHPERLLRPLQRQPDGSFAEASSEAALDAIAEQVAAIVREIGSSTNRLVSTDHHFDPITGMARQSAIPVNVRLAPPAG
jgi:anaerobic selenocysteine-containing dehydrogenase